MKRRFIDNLDSPTRKEFPICTGALDYAPDALAAVAHISYLGNEKHNKGEPLHHARGKSMDHADCDVRHQSTRFDVDPAYADDILAPVFHMAEHTWRALMQLQEAMEKVYDLAPAPGARWPHERADTHERVAIRAGFGGDVPPLPSATEVDAADVKADGAHDDHAAEGMTRMRRAFVECADVDPETKRACQLREHHSGLHEHVDFDATVQWRGRHHAMADATEIIGRAPSEAEGFGPGAIEQADPLQFDPSA